MPTDGADFQRRRIFHGKYYVEVKSGADAARLAQVALEGVVREIKQDRKMPMLRPMVDAAINCLQGGLFATNTGSCAQELNAQLSPITSQFSELGATREVLQLVVKAALDIRSQAGQLPAEQCRDVLLKEFGHKLLQTMSLDFASGYTVQHRNIDATGLEQLESSIHAAAESDLCQIVKTIYDSPIGVPARRSRRGSEPMVLHTSEALSSEMLAPER